MQVAPSGGAQIDVVETLVVGCDDLQGGHLLGGAVMDQTSVEQIIDGALLFPLGPECVLDCLELLPDPESNGAHPVFSPGANVEQLEELSGPALSPEHAALAHERLPTLAGLIHRSDIDAYLHIRMTLHPGRACRPRGAAREHESSAVDPGSAIYSSPRSACSADHRRSPNGPAPVPRHQRSVRRSD